MPELRRKGFRLGTWHGKAPTADDREYAIQRALYLYGGCLVPHRDSKSHIRLRPIAYEMPLYSVSRGKSVDVVAYDQRLNIYLIEVKRARNEQSLADAIDQLNEYAEIFKKIKTDVEAEFNERFHFGAVFNKIVKLVVAPSDFYGDEDKMFLDSFGGDVRVGYIGRIRSDEDAKRLLWTENPRPIRIHFRRVPANAGLGT
jgi:hypothetical protein